MGTFADFIYVIFLAQKNLLFSNFCGRPEFPGHPGNYPAITRHWQLPFELLGLHFPIFAKGHPNSLAPYDGRLNMKVYVHNLSPPPITADTEKHLPISYSRNLFKNKSYRYRYRSVINSEFRTNKVTDTDTYPYCPVPPQPVPSPSEKLPIRNFGELTSGSYRYRYQYRYQYRYRSQIIWIFGIN